MTEGEDTTDSGDADSDEFKFSWGSLRQIIKNMFSLERSFASLKAENKELRRDVRELQRQMDEQSGKLEALSVFIGGAIHDKIEAQAEKAALRAVETTLEILRATPRDRT
jgi:predicted transcriptional regulator